MENAVVEFVGSFIPAMSVFAESVICSVSNRSVGLMKGCYFKIRFFAEECNCSKIFLRFFFGKIMEVLFPSDREVCFFQQITVE